jgi:hypothetical protein
MEMDAAATVREVGGQIFPGHNHGRIVVQPSGAATHRLEDAGLHSLIEEEVGAHADHQETLLEVHRPGQTLHEEKPAIVVRKVNAVVAISYHGHGRLCRHELTLPGLEIGGREGCEAQVSGDVVRDGLGALVVRRKDKAPAGFAYELMT